MIRRAVFACFHPSKRTFLGLGVANLPLEADTAALARVHRKYGGYPDMCVLEAIEPMEDWTLVKRSWKTRFDEVFAFKLDVKTTDAKKAQDEFLSTLKTDAYTWVLGASLVKPTRNRVLSD